jgi:hypothetical protein
VRLARVQGNQIVPWIADASIPEWQRWSLSEVKLSAKRVTWDATCAPEWQSRIDNSREDWSRFEQRTPVVVLQPIDDGNWTGSLLRNDGVITLGYSEGTGASYTK